MMCLMKTFTGFGGFLTLLIGLAMLGVTIYAFTQEASTFHQYGFLIILVVADVLIIIASVLGIIGVKRQKGILILIFQILIMIFFGCFLTIGVFAIIIPKNIYNGNCSDSSNQLIYTFYQSYTYAEPNFCITAQCGLTNQAISSSNYTTSQQITLSALNRTNSAPLNYQTTPQGQSQTQDNATLYSAFAFLKALQSQNQCSGWCSNDSSLIYYFSDVNNGKPQTTCYGQAKQELESIGNIVAIAAFSTAGLMLLVCICGLAVCCSKKDEPLASRFVVLTQQGYLISKQMT